MLDSKRATRGFELFHVALRFCFKRAALILIAAVGMGAGQLLAQPALTTIQDILYRADGTRFDGTMFISWASFLAGDTSNIAQANVTLQIVNGVVNVKLVPTTTATAGAQYTVTYESAGYNQFTETWAVPPSATPLTVRDVRLTTASVVGPAPVVSPIQISDVTGLSNALSVRPAEGVGFAIGRAAIINSSGLIEGATGNLGDCVRVDGSSGACGGGGGGTSVFFSDGEIPGGTIDGLNTMFSLMNAPSPVGSLSLYRNGVLQEQGQDYVIAGTTITMFLGSIPQPGDSLVASYRYANPSNPLGTLAAPQVICSSVGTTTSATTLTSLGTCTLAAGLLGTGDRIEVQFHIAHTGGTVGFTGALQWAGATILSQSGVAADGILAGKATFGVYAAGQSWDAQTWGSSSALATSAGLAGANTTANLTIGFFGQMPGTTTDSVTLSNFTVIRYPAQTNP